MPVLSNKWSLRHTMGILAFVLIVATAATALPLIAFKQLCAFATKTSAVAFKGFSITPNFESLDCSVVALAPGQALDITDKITLEGFDRLESSEQLLIATVSINDDPNLLEWMESSSDDFTHMRTWKSLYGDLSSEELLQYAASQMTSSQDRATLAALNYLGLQVAKSTGVGFSNILPDTPASGVLRVGDVIIAVDDQPITTVQSLIEAMEGRKSGTTVVLTLRRYELDGNASEAETTGNNDSSATEADTGDFTERKERIVLSPHPDHGQGFIGISGLHEILDRKSLPFEIDIDIGSIGGPSAGLLFTLALIDFLTPGRLAGDLVVAATGTISIDGTVGPVGSIQQKTIAARDWGADIFIVPDDLQAEALLAAGSMPVIGISTLEEAIQALGQQGGDIDDLKLSASLHKQMSQE
ncbi:MAG: PDZ domain-containing protein [Acidimicrobiaceae bacterium]|nr:PDZ domain-containing protein [Acidimicrobiaceae bacterium]